MERVVIGMSGGVDSSVAAAVLKEQGYDVVGVTMRLWDGETVEGEELESTCCSLSAVEDARRVAFHLGIDYYVLDFRKEFSASVIDYFANEYLLGRTPNPCIACNRHLKFDAMLKKAELLGADKVATGHYANIDYDAASGRYLLRRAAAATKDQTYALYALTQAQLAHTLMPLGQFKSKDEVREYAKKLGLPTAKKKDSMEICFVPDQDYAAFIQRRVGALPPEGDFVDLEGNVLGRHKGVVHYTVGQRKGLGIAFGKPMFVVRIDAAKNQVVLGESGSEFSDSLLAIDENLIPFDDITAPIRADIKVRYSAKPAPGEISREGKYLRVRFDQPQRAITPGQAVVFYQPNGDLVLGGATILR